MKIDDSLGVSVGKLEALRTRVMRLGVDLSKIEESFSRGGGKGGQKVNKTSNRVQLYYAPLDIRVACHRERSRGLNRFFALRELVDQVEMKVSPETSERLREMERIRRRKARAHGRAARKHAPPEAA